MRKYPLGTKLKVICKKARHSGFSVGKNYVFESKSYGYHTKDDGDIGYSTNLTMLKKYFEIKLVIKK